MAKPILILQLRPEDETSDNEFEAVVKYSGLDPKDVRRMRIEKTGIPSDLVLENYSAMIVGGSPFDISTPQEKKSAIQVRSYPETSMSAAENDSAPEQGVYENRIPAVCVFKYNAAQLQKRLSPKGLAEKSALAAFALAEEGAKPARGQGRLARADFSANGEYRGFGIASRIEKDFMRLLDEVVANDFPFLGACSGNGLLGKYLGAPISTRYAEAVGCAILQLTEEGRKDPLLSGFPDQISVLLGHKEACDHVPDGATLLMTGTACPVQMFRVGRNVYATQFHPEGDAEGFTVRINIYKNHGYFKPHEADDLIEKLRHAKTSYSQKILRRFVDRYMV